MKINYPQIAKEAVENFIKNKTIKEFPQKTNKKAGVFVSIYKKTKNGKELRGCIGTLVPTQENIIKEIVQNAISAATQDNRFLPVTKNELPYLSYSVDILKKPKLVKDIKELNPKKYGIIVKTLDGRTDVLLPNIEGIDNIKQQIAIACMKANINPLKENILIYKFEVLRYREK